MTRPPHRRLLSPPVPIDLASARRVFDGWGARALLEGEAALLYSANAEALNAVVDAAETASKGLAVYAVLGA